MNDMHSILDEIGKSNGLSVLATVIKIEGSAYRKEGTCMLFTEDGRQIGIISAGCLETDLAIRAENLLKDASMQSHIVVYDMRAEDDLSWGRGAGCNGKVHTLLEKVNPVYKAHLLEVKKHLDEGTPVKALKRIDQDTVRTTFITRNQHIFGNEHTLSQHQLPFLLDGDKSGMVEDAEANIFIHHFHPKSRLFIFGAGPDVQPLARIAAQTGFSVKVWDWRPALLKQEDFPDAHLLEDLPLTEVVSKGSFTAGDYVVIMTHDFQKDQAILHAFLRQKHLSYLGILGPRKRTARLLQEKPIPDFLHSPVGLSINAEGPEEIAISIIAEVIQTQREGKAQDELTSWKRRANSD